MHHILFNHHKDEAFMRVILNGSEWDEVPQLRGVNVEIGHVLVNEDSVTCKYFLPPQCVRGNKSFNESNYTLLKTTDKEAWSLDKIRLLYLDQVKKDFGASCTVKLN